MLPPVTAGSASPSFVHQRPSIDAYRTPFSMNAASGVSVPPSPAVPESDREPLAPPTAVADDTSLSEDAALSHDSAAILRTIRTCLVLLAITSTSVAIYFGKDIVMPVALGLLITLTLTPPVRWLRRRGLPAGVAAILVVLSVGGAIGTGAYFLSAPVGDLIDTAPQIGSRIEERMSEMRSSVESISEVSDKVDELADGGGSADGTQVVVVKQPGLVSTATSTLASGMISLAVALVFALFMLASGDLFYEKLITIMPGLREKKKALRIVHDVEGNVSRYLFTITLINTGLGIVIGTQLYAYGMPGAALWGVIAAVTNFLPFVGALIGAGLLGAISLGHFDGLWPALIPPAIYIGCTTIEGNVLTPLIVGRRLELNTVAVFLAVALWGWLWGIAGALMAVPLLVVFKVLCDHVDSLHGWGEFLSGRRAQASVATDRS